MRFSKRKPWTVAFFAIAFFAIAGSAQLAVQNFRDGADAAGGLWASWGIFMAFYYWGPGE